MLSQLKAELGLPLICPAIGSRQTRTLSQFKFTYPG